MLSLLIRVKKSSNFDDNLNAARQVKQIDENMFKLSRIFRGDANSIAPHDSGTLRREAKTENNYLFFSVTWGVDYAKKVYEKNKKNPKSTQWAAKAQKKYNAKYKKILTEGVIK